MKGLYGPPLAARITPFDLPPLQVSDISGFLALREAEPCPALQALADACVAGLDAHRAAADDAELARRRKNGLKPAQDAMLNRWGYPHVFETWFFHMTLTKRLTPEQHAVIRPLVEAHVAAALPYPRRVDALSIFTQAAAGAPFLIAERLAFKG